jgi:hypothetical protein
MQLKSHLLTRSVVVSAAAIGAAAGSYGIAAAATGSGSAAQATTPTATTPAPSTAAQGWGRRRSDETALTGDALSKVTAVAKDALPGATIVRVETDADGHAKYEAHVIKSDGSLATVYVDESFKLVSVDTGGPGGGFGGPHGAPPSSSSGTTTTA